MMDPRSFIGRVLTGRLADEDCRRGFGSCDSCERPRAESPSWPARLHRGMHALRATTLTTPELRAISRKVLI